MAAHIESGAFGPGATPLEPIDHNTQLLKPINQPIRAR